MPLFTRDAMKLFKPGGEATSSDPCFGFALLGALENGGTLTASKPVGRTRSRRRCAFLPPPEAGHSRSRTSQRARQVDVDQHGHPEDRAPMGRGCAARLRRAGRRSYT